jgi:hypothetical protein
MAKSATLMIRSKTTTALAPGQMGFADLTAPKGFGTDDPKFNVDYHVTPAGIDANRVILEAKLADLLPRLQEEIEKANADGSGFKPKAPVSIDELIEQKLKEPRADRPKMPQLPYMRIGAPGATKKGPSSMVAWSPDNQLLDLAKLRMAAGTWFEPIIWVNLFISKTAMGAAGPQQPCLSFKLVGVRIRELVQFGGGRGVAPPGADDAAIAAVMGSKFDASAQDFSAFGLTSDAPHVDHGDDEEVDPRSVF